jgi:hypothetical protein
MKTFTAAQRKLSKIALFLAESEVSAAAGPALILIAKLQRELRALRGEQIQRRREQSASKRRESTGLTK